MKSFPVKPEQKVTGILKQHPQTYQVFRKHGCPDMRSGVFSVMARFMSLRNAARIHRIPEDKLLNDLNESICPQQDRSEKKE